MVFSYFHIKSDEKRPKEFEVKESELEIQKEEENEEEEDDFLVNPNHRLVSHSSLFLLKGLFKKVKVKMRTKKKKMKMINSVVIKFLHSTKIFV